MRTDPGLDALRMALTLRAPGASVALTHHSDAASQYTFIRLPPDPRRPGLLASIGTVGDACDNAAAESFVTASRPS